VPSAEVTVLMSSTFLAVVLKQTQETEETERQRGRTDAAFAHFEVARRVPRRPLRLHKLKPGVGSVPKPSIRRDCETCRKPTLQRASRAVCRNAREEVSALAVLSGCRRQHDSGCRSPAGPWRSAPHERGSGSGDLPDRDVAAALVRTSMIPSSTAD